MSCQAVEGAQLCAKSHAIAVVLRRIGYDSDTLAVSQGRDLHACHECPDMAGSSASKRKPLVR